MAYPAYVKEKARKLRQEKKLTIDELSERLAISRTTIYYWVRDMRIPRSSFGGGFSASARRKGNKAMREKYRDLRDAAYDEGVLWFPFLEMEPSFRDFVCMYVGEGYKRCRNTVSLGNSDPSVVKLANYWICRLSRNPVGYSVQIHADQCPDAIAAFWGSELDVDAGDIRIQRKSNSGRLARRTWRCRHGVLKVRTADTYLRAELRAWMDWIQGEWG
jgi:excisionase family DNA binding protein